jgi:hypothetical protein
MDYSNKTSNCYYSVGNLLIQMIDQGVFDISKVNHNLPSSFDSSKPIINQIKDVLDAVNPVIYNFFLIKYNGNGYSNYSYDFKFHDLIKLKNNLKNNMDVNILLISKLSHIIVLLLLN